MSGLRRSYHGTDHPGKVPCTKILGSMKGFEVGYNTGAPAGRAVAEGREEELSDNLTALCSCSGGARRDSGGGAAARV